MKKCRKYNDGGTIMSQLDTALSDRLTSLNNITDTTSFYRNMMGTKPIDNVEFSDVFQPDFSFLSSIGGSPVMSGISAGLGILNNGINAIKASREVKKANKKINEMNSFIEESSRNKAEGLNRSAFDTMIASYKALGGDLDNGVSIIGNGNTHENNPYGGVPFGMNSQGIPNLLEEDEVVFDNYVFSNRITMPEELKKKYKIKGNTFAEGAKYVQKESEERPNDPISRNGLEAMMEILRNNQEQSRIPEEGNVFEKGGYPEISRPKYINRVDHNIKTPVISMNMKSSEIPAYSFRKSSGNPFQWSNTYLRYAPVVGSAINAVTDLFGFTNKPDYSVLDEIDKYSTPVSYVPKYIGNYMTYNPIDTDYMMNKLGARSAAVRNQILNNSGGNRNVANAMLLQADYNDQTTGADAYIKAKEYNDNLRRTTTQFNNSIDMFNSELYNKEIGMRMGENAQIINNILNKERMKQSLDNASSAAISANLTNLFDNIGNVGREDMTFNMLNSTPGLYYMMDRTGDVGYKKRSNGGYLTVKKRRK